MTLNAIKQLRNPVSRDEETQGFTIVEVMIAAIIIVIILLSTAYGLTSSFRASSNIENTNKATALANDLIAVSKQAPYADFYIANRTIPVALVAQDKCNPGALTPTGTVIASGSSTGNYVNRFRSCQEMRFSEVGASFFVSTQISYLVNPVSFDNGGAAVTNGGYIAKRIYVTIRWRDVKSGETAWNTVRATYTKTPSASECIPDRITLIGSQPAGCRV